MFLLITNALPLGRDSRMDSAWMADGDVGTSHMSNLLQMSVTT
jgi:hypothetical protein